MPHTRAPKIFWLLAAFIVLGAVYAFVTPLFEISDELWHYPMVKTLADGNGLPVQDPANPGPWRQEGSQPPLYYMAMALATRWIDTSDMAQVRWLNPHADNGIITEDGNNNIVIHRPGEMGRLTGTVLAVRLIRLLSVLMGAGTVYFTYRLALELLPEQEWLALASAAFVAFTPMFLFISASVNNDNLAILCSSATLWLLARWLRNPPPPAKIGWPHFWLGVLLGCGALSKQSALGLWGLAGLVLLASRLLANQRISDWRIGIWDLGLEIIFVFGFAALLSFWWYLRNYQLYGDWLGWNTFIAIVGPRPRPASLAILWGERVGFLQAFWGLFGGVSVAMPDWVYAVLNAFLGLAGVGLIVGAFSFVRPRRFTLASAAGWALPVGWLVLISIGLIRWTSLTWASQGRLIFPAFSAIAVLAVTGLTHLSSLFIRHSSLVIRHSSFVIGHLSFVIPLSVAVPFTVLAPHYAPPPALTLAQIAAIPHRLDADFGGEMILLGYQLDTTSVSPGGVVRLTLYWQSQIPLDRNWSLFVHLVDADGIIVAQRDRYPGQGALATTLLTPGQTFADEYVIPLPAETYAPTQARVEVGVYDLLDGTRLTGANAADAVTLTESLTIDGRTESTRLGEIPNALHQNFGGQIELLGYTLESRVLRPGETLHLTLYWRALRDGRVNYAVFTHVRGEGETLWAGQDAWPQRGAAPTAAWRAGEIISDPYELTLKPGTPPGQYPVEVGLYEAASLARLQLIAADGRWTDADFLDLSKIRVVAP